MENSILLAQMTPETLQEMIRTTLRAEFNTLMPPPQETNYLTRSEVCTLLHISLPTLGDYVRNGTIKGHKIGRRVLFEEAEIKHALQEIPSIKYSRTVRR